MEWVIGTFNHMAGVWEERAGEMGSIKPGHRAYALRETERWNRWARIAQIEFTKVTGVKETPPTTK